MTIKELKIEYAEKCHVFDECEMLRNMVNWMDHRDEHLNQNKSTDQLLREFLKEATGK